MVMCIMIYSNTNCSHDLVKIQPASSSFPADYTKEYACTHAIVKIKLNCILIYFDMGVLLNIDFFQQL